MIDLPQVRHWIEEKAECSYCLGSGKCYLCDGLGATDDGHECDDCYGARNCQQCVGGQEQWLFFEAPGGGIRGSCLTHQEVDSFLRDQTLPSWWSTYHGVTATPPDTPRS